MDVQDGAQIYDKAFREGFAPDPDETVSEWADKFRKLSSKASAEPGPWRTSRTPYLKEIMDCLSPSSPTREVDFMKAAQVGGTELGLNWLGFLMHRAPTSILAVQPTEPMMKKAVRQRIDPMIQECPELREVVAAPRSRNATNNTLMKEYRGGMLMLTGANSAANLRSMPVGKLFLDEVDGYPLDVDGEGDPVDLAVARARTFYNRKIFKCSTPTIAGRSRIEASFEEGTMEYYQVPCPYCHHKQKLVFGNLDWEADPKDVRYRCTECGVLIEEHHKAQMLSEGVWVAENPEADPLHRSFHLNSLYSPWWDWKELVKSFIKAKGNVEKLRVFVNTVLGETWQEAGEAPDWEHLFNRREDYKGVPAGALLLTCGVDLQKDRIEYEVVGWGRDLESWGVEYGAVPCDTSDLRELSEALNKLKSRTWKHHHGAELNIAMMAVDSGYNTQVVYNWVRDQSPGQSMAIKGHDRSPVLVGRPKTVEVTMSGRRIQRGAKLWPVGVGVAKSELYGWLRQRYASDSDEPVPVGYCHFPMTYDTEYFKGLCSEELRVKNTGGRRRYFWFKTYERNEPLDCRNYNRAASARLGIDRFSNADWEAFEALLCGEENLKKEATPPSGGFLGDVQTREGWLH